VRPTEVRNTLAKSEEFASYWDRSEIAFESLYYLMCSTINLYKVWLGIKRPHGMQLVTALALQLSAMSNLHSISLRPHTTSAHTANAEFHHFGTVFLWSLAGPLTPTNYREVTYHTGHFR
jgi:hypothetical protein